MKLAIISIFCFLFFQSYSQNQVVWDKSDPTWDWVGANGNSAYLIRKTYETKSDGEITVWIKVVNSATRIKDNTAKIITIENVLYGFDCVERKIKIMSYVKYSQSGKILKHVTIEEYEQKWNSVVPETIGEGLLIKACAME